MKKLLLAYLLTFLAIGGAGLWVAQSLNLFEGSFILTKKRASLTFAVAEGSMALKRKDWALMQVTASNATGPVAKTRPGVDGIATLYLEPGAYTLQAAGIEIQEQDIVSCVGSGSLIVPEDETAQAEVAMECERLREIDKIRELLIAAMEDGDLQQAQDLRLFVKTHDMSDTDFFIGSVEELAPIMNDVAAAVALLTQIAEIEPSMYNTLNLELSHVQEILAKYSPSATAAAFRWNDQVQSFELLRTQYAARRDEVFRSHYRNVATFAEKRLYLEALREWVFIDSNPELDPEFPPTSEELVAKHDELRGYSDHLMDLIEEDFEREVKEGSREFYAGNLMEAENIFASLKAKIEGLVADVDFPIDLLTDVNQYTSDLENFYQGNRFFEAGEFAEALRSYEQVYNASALLEERKEWARNRLSGPE